jgi:hypothetical protein
MVEQQRAGEFLEFGVCVGLGGNRRTAQRSQLEVDILDEFAVRIGM